jgi:hypothetical protein
MSVVGSASKPTSSEQSKLFKTLDELFADANFQKSVAKTDTSSIIDTCSLYDEYIVKMADNAKADFKKFIMHGNLSSVPQNAATMSTKPFEDCACLDHATREYFRDKRLSGKSTLSSVADQQNVDTLARLLTTVQHMNSRS